MEPEVREPTANIPRALTIAVSPRTILVLLGIVAALWVLLNFTHLLVLVLAAILLAGAIDGPVTWLQRKGVPRPAGVLAVYLLILSVLAIVVVLLVTLISAEIAVASDAMPRYMADIERIVNRIVPNSHTKLNFDTLATQLSAHLNEIALRLTAISLVTARILVLAFATIVLAYFFAVRPDLLHLAINRFLPSRHHARVRKIDAGARQRIGGWARGQVMVAGSFGLLLGIGLWAIGVPYAASLALIAALLEVLPYVGGIVTLLLAVPLALSVSPWHALITVIFYLILAQVEAHIVSPYFLGRGVGLPPVVVLLALLAGAEIGGFLGIILAVPLTVVVWSVVDEIWPADTPASEPDPTESPPLEPQ